VIESEEIIYLLEGYDVALFSSFFFSLIIVLSGRLHLKFSSRNQGSKEIQRSHIQPTPRIGGVAVLIGCLSAWYVSDNLAREVLGILICSSLPVLLFGLLDDLYFDIPPSYRLIAGSVSAVIAILLLDTWLTRVDVFVFDQFFLYAPFAIIFTIFATTGVCHAFNVIDGLHGLSLGISLSVSFFLTVIAWMTADVLIVLLSLVFFLSTLGLLLLNYPWGKIFLGDGGAYFQGHCLSWIGILLISRNPEITPWSVLLIFFWPVVETIYSIFRRIHKNKSSALADRAHFHQIIYDRVKNLKIFKSHSSWANAFSTFLLIPLFTFPSVVSLFLYNDMVKASIAFLFFFSIYIITYNFIKPSA
jgi:UDP-N-acetylmuramyl pentapeptide phosphotransferase/UDP-N-acetylglucosamine-1-phosphate transferase